MKKGFTLVEIIGVIAIIAIISLLALPPIINLMKNNKKEISTATEKVILSAASLYGDFLSFDNHPKNIYCMTVKDLADQDLMELPIIDAVSNKEIPETKKIKGFVENGNFKYVFDDGCVPFNTSLIFNLKQQYKDRNTVGLVKDKKSYYYKGTNKEVTNNFVWYEGHLWRVIEVNSDNTVTMITQQPLTSIQPSHLASWETEQQYKDSYINKWLNDVFYNSISDKSKIQQSIYNVGIYSNVSEITTTQYVGLLNDEQYTRVGFANNFLNIKEFFWLGNRYDFVLLRSVMNDGKKNDNDSTDALGVRPVIKISDLTIMYGNGTLSNPFREDVKTINTTNVKIGEYISVPGSSSYCGEDARCLFRVVSKDDDSVKVILNGVIPTLSVFGEKEIFSKSYPIYTLLNSFANSIPSTYRYNYDKTFNVGYYRARAAYIDVTTKIMSSNVGLPVVGEMFSGNDIDITNPLTSDKTFVNISTIENPTTSTGFWLMNAKDWTSVRNIGYHGIIGFGSFSDTNGVRPVIFLNKGTTPALTFTKGDGTAENPYFLGN